MCRNDVYVNYLDCGDGLRTVYICQGSSKTHTLNMCNVLYIKHTTITLWKKGWNHFLKKYNANNEGK